MADFEAGKFRLAPHPMTEMRLMSCLGGGMPLENDRQQQLVFVGRTGYRAVAWEECAICPCCSSLLWSRHVVNYHLPIISWRGVPGATMGYLAYIRGIAILKGRWRIDPRLGDLRDVRRFALVLLTQVFRAL